MSTQNIQFHDKLRKFPKYLFSGAIGIGIISLELKNEFELGVRAIEIPLHILGTLCALLLLQL